jgi:hypothetical protein
VLGRSDVVTGANLTKLLASLTLCRIFHKASTPGAMINHKRVTKGFFELCACNKGHVFSLLGVLKCNLTLWIRFTIQSAQTVSFL